MKPINWVLILPAILFSLPALAEELPIQVQTQGEVTFISGGVGVDEQNAMQAVRGEYNLSLLFSVAGTGEYLSDVRVHITDLGGNTYLETVSDGPKLFAKLKPGRYKITVDQDGRALHKTATIGSKQRTTLSFTWPKNQGD